MSDEEIHARLAPFAGWSRREMDEFCRWQECGNLARSCGDRVRAWARLERWLRDQLRVHGKYGGTQAGASRARDEEKPSDAGQQE